MCHFPKDKDEIVLFFYFLQQSINITYTVITRDEDEKIKYTNTEFLHLKGTKGVTLHINILRVWQFGTIHASHKLSQYSRDNPNSCSRIFIVDQ